MNASTTEWAAVAAAAALIVMVGGIAFVRPSLPQAASGWSRIAGVLLAAQGAAALLVATVLIGAGVKAAQLDPAARGDDRPTNAFARYLIDANPDSTERVALYAAMILVPLAAVLGVLALAAVDAGRSIGLRSIAGLVATAVLVVCGVVALGDTGALAGRAAVGIAGLALGSLVALVADELAHERQLGAPT